MKPTDFRVKISPVKHKLWDWKTVVTRLTDAVKLTEWVSGGLEIAERTAQDLAERLGCTEKL